MSFGTACRCRMSLAAACQATTLSTLTMQWSKGMKANSTGARAQALPLAPGLVQLDLSGNLLEDDKAHLLACGLAQSRITRLCLAHNRVRTSPAARGL